MQTLPLDRRDFLIATGVTSCTMLSPTARAAGNTPQPQTAAADDIVPVPDTGWRLIVDDKAPWRDDDVFLPGDVDLSALPEHAPTGGWKRLDTGLDVTLPATVEQYCWGAYGLRPYTPEEYRYADDDTVPQNGVYVGVSWWVQDFDIPAAARGKRVLLNIRAARLRTEVYLNEKLVGYSLMAELPFSCDLTEALRPGTNRLALRITNPGGRFDWKDSGTIRWGKVSFYPGHGFGGLDRGLTLSLHPREARIADAWVLNTPDPHTVTAYAEILPETLPKTLAGLERKISVALFEAESGTPVAAEISIAPLTLSDGTLRAEIRLRAPTAKLWDLDSPTLYRVEFAWAEAADAIDRRSVRFGFRWFAPEGFGTDAQFRLNGRRIKLYSAISWGYWGLNGLWPTPELAVREVTAAKALGLNCLHFHRNLGRTDVLDRQDERGLLRVMEPGAGRMTIGTPGKAPSAAKRFERAYQIARTLGMVKAFRSHPSLVQYTLQNELSADLANPDVEEILRRMHALDPSRAVVLNDGFVARGAAQAMFHPYDDTFHRSDKEFAGGWWNNHQGAGDQWYDSFYQDKEHFVHRQTARAAIVEFGEMEGCAVCDDHTLDAAEILARGGKSYDLADHKEIVAGTNAFLDRFGFRKDFPTAEALFRSVGCKSYDSWQNYLENIRICDEIDIACISGWESTAIENHSGIVSNMRNFRAEPERVRSSLLPVRPVAKQRKLVYELGETATLDLYLLNDTGKPVRGTLRLSLIRPDGKEMPVGNYTVPAFKAGQFSALVAERVATPAFAAEGLYKIRFALAGVPAFEREIWAVDTRAKPQKRCRIGVAGIAQSLRKRLGSIPGIVLEDFSVSGQYDGILASGLKADEIARRQIGDQTGLEARPAKGEKPQIVLGELPAGVLEAVKAGTPLIALVPEDGLADGVAKQLAALGLFDYDGQVGDLRAPWMGNWNFLKTHPLFAGIPAGRAAGVLHQIPGQPSNGLLVSGNGLEVLAGYSRDHDRRVGAASFIARKDRMRVLVHRMPDMVAPLQTRWYRNVFNWLTN